MKQAVKISVADADPSECFLPILMSACHQYIYLSEVFWILVHYQIPLFSKHFYTHFYRRCIFFIFLFFWLHILSPSSALSYLLLWLIIFLVSPSPSLSLPYFYHYPFDPLIHLLSHCLAARRAARQLFWTLRNKCPQWQVRNFFIWQTHSSFLRPMQWLIIGCHHVFKRFHYTFLAIIPHIFLDFEHRFWWMLSCSN